MLITYMYLKVDGSSNIKYTDTCNVESSFWKNTSVDDSSVKMTHVLLRSYNSLRMFALPRFNECIPRVVHHNTSMLYHFHTNCKNS